MVPPKLEAPDWLVKLAARDDPPTVIEDELLERFERVGVVELVPTVDREIVPHEDGLDATGIGPRGPGIAIGESFEDEPAPVAGALERLVVNLERFDQLRRLRLAAIDMRLAEGTALALRDRDGPARFFERVLETGLVVTYARPYLHSNQAGVGRRWQPPPGSDRDFHHWLIDEMRDSYHAHADRTPRRTLVDTAEMLGLDGPPTYAEGWWILSDDELKRIAELARKQAERFEAAALEAGRKLGEERDEPRSVDEEFERLRRGLADRETSEREDEG